MSQGRDIVRAYHEATKHHTHAYAPSPGFLDWDSQPDPFRRFPGAPAVSLPLVEGPAPGLDPVERLGLFLELALGLSAWKALGPDRWALRNTPSSGNLHPTEGYVLLWRRLSAQIGPGLYHYAVHDHALERRAVLPDAVADAVAEAVAAACPDAFGALGLSSVIWREEWKYGARAYRYCQLDVGHALGAARTAAQVVGWSLHADAAAGDDVVAACLGLGRPEFAEVEAEHPDLLAVLGEGTPPWDMIAAGLNAWAGVPGRVSAERVAWPEIAAVLPAVHRPTLPASEHTRSRQTGVSRLPEGAGLARLIRQRRSAQRMDGKTAMTLAALRGVLEGTLPAAMPLDAFPHAPAVNLLLFVHAVEGLEPGLYAYERAPERGADFRAACSAPLEWAPMGEGLYRLRAPEDLRREASRLSCHQGIAGRGAVAVGMIGALGPVLEEDGAWAYRRLYWEAGMIGQALYLGAEAAGLRGTGIGCYFDDAVHGLLGLAPDGPWQSLYHFTIGGALDDARLGSEPPYAHLGARP